MTAMNSWTRGFRRDDRSLALEGSTESLLLDLMDVAAEAYLEDRARKRGRAGEPSWHRTLSLKLRVRNIDIWASPSTLNRLSALLDWLTGDSWNIHVADAPPANHEWRQGQIRFGDPPDEIALFSGGLDATAGLVQLLASGRRPLAVSVVTNDAMYGYQQRVIQALATGSKRSITHLPVKVQSLQGSERDEPTRRTRGFLFLAVGVAAAIAHGLDRLLMLENGIGAINLPYTAAQWGPMTSRAAHPKTLRLMENLLESILGRPFQVHNPHVGETKGEMCAVLPDWAKDGCAASESCDMAAAGRGQLAKRCGECTSCLLRRVSLNAAGRNNWDPRPYRSDVVGPRPDRDRTPEALWQVARLDEALRGGGSEALSAAFPALDLVPSEILDVEGQKRLLATYVNEWRSYSDPRVPLFLPSSPLEV